MTNATEQAEKRVNVKWTVCVAGHGEQFVQAAEVVHHRATDGYSSIRVADGVDVILTSLIDEDGHLVFQAPAQAVAYIRRESQQDGG